MRNLIWTGTALVLVIGASFFMAARHAARHPDSFVARYSMAIYHMCDAFLAPGGGARPVEEIAQAPETAPATPLRSAPAAEIIEPIVVEPTDQEPPLALPRLAPEIAAAIERLRDDEESEAPRQAFDGPGQAPRMPYADEEVEVLPLPTLNPAVGPWDTYLPQSGGLSFLPASWQMVLDKVMESLHQHRDPE
jgi:hypothetical protein